MIPRRLCTRRRAESPERRVARGRRWCRRVEVLPHLPSPRLPKALRGSRHESSPSLTSPSTTSTSPSFSSLGGVARGGGLARLPHVESLDAWAHAVLVEAPRSLAATRAATCTTDPLLRPHLSLHNGLCDYDDNVAMLLVMVLLFVAVLVVVAVPHVTLTLAVTIPLFVPILCISRPIAALSAALDAWPDGVPVGLAEGDTRCLAFFGDVAHFSCGVHAKVVQF